MGTLKVFDTNAVIAVAGGTLSQQPDITVVISIVTRLELLCWPDLTDFDRSEVRNMVDSLPTIQITEEIENHVVAIRTSKLLKLPDAIIAATALHLGVPLVSRDRAFDRVPGLTVEPF